MIPIGDNVPRSRVPLVTWGIILINVLIFVWQSGLSETELVSFFYSLGVVPLQFLAGDYEQVWVLLTSMFVHGNLGHLIGNMWILGLFGDNVEDRMGRLSYFAFYILCGVFAGLVHIFINPSSMVPTVGASGAIAGIMAAYLFLFPLARVTALVPVFIIPYFFRVPSFIFIGVWFLTQVYYGTLALGITAFGGVAWWAHIGGFIFGALIYRFFLRRPNFA